VRVAIIDDGVDGFHEDLRGKIKAGWPREKATSVWEPFYRSDHGHGTAMARLIAAACPHVDLYVAKLKTLSKHISPEQADSLMDEDHPDGSIGASSGWLSTAYEAAQAVDWARRKGVHVVCMSWSMQAAFDSAAQTRLLSQRIQEAARDGIIMYCSASDEGLYGALKTLYPAAADTAGVRVVGSATERGNSSDSVNADLVSYLFPGEQIDEIGSEKKGSSAATALAAGFAALVLWCFGVARPQSRAGMGSPQAMHYLFEGLQSLLAAKGQEGRRTKWVDASMLLELGGIEEVVEFVEGEVRRRDPDILPKGKIPVGQRLSDSSLCEVGW
jgi:subtilisin family serine protease